MFTKKNPILTWISWIFVITFVVFYPAMISIHVFLPMLVGFFGLMLIYGIEGRGARYILVPIMYLINLEVNLSLPLFMTSLAVFMYYLTLYEKVMFLKRCRVCVAVLSVVMIDVYYVALLWGYDLLMDSHSIEVNKLLLYSLLTDILLVVFA